jgi:hypothetical protein
MMNEELLAANALLVQVASYWSVSISSWRKVCKLQLSSVKPTQVSNSGTSKGIGNLNSAFKKAGDYYCRTKAYRQSV